MKHLLFIFLLAPLFLNAQYKITPEKIFTWSAFSISGALYGAREAYHSDPYIFEKKWDVDKYSFFGSKQWERNYHGNRHIGESGFPNSHKTEIFGNFGRDYWHTSSYASGALILGGTFVIGSSDQKLKYKLVDMLIGSVCFLGASHFIFKYFKQ